MAEVLEAMAASQEQGHKRLEALWAVLKTISDRQKESKKELLDAFSSKFEVLSAKDDGALAEEIQALKDEVTRQFSKPRIRESPTTSRLKHGI